MNDKMKHFIAGALTAIAIALPVYADGTLFCGVWSAVLSAAAVGAGKEFADMQHGCPFDWLDLCATIAGGAAVALFVLLMEVSIG